MGKKKYNNHFTTSVPNKLVKEREFGGWEQGDGAGGGSEEGAT